MTDNNLEQQDSMNSDTSELDFENNLELDADNTSTSEDPHWNAFLKLVNEDELSDSHTYSMEPEVRDQLQARIDQGTNDQLVAHHYAAFVETLNQSASFENESSEEVDLLAELDDFSFELAMDEPEMAHPDLAEPDDIFAESPVADSIHQDDVFSLDDLATDADFENGQNSPDANKASTIKSDVEADELLDDDQEERLDNGLDRKPTQQPGSHDYQPTVNVGSSHNPGTAYVPARQEGARLMSAMLGTAANVANVATAIAGAGHSAASRSINAGRSAFNGWLDKRAQARQESVNQLGESVDDNIASAEQMSPEEGLSKRESFRESVFGSATRNISSIIRQGREEMSFMTERVQPELDMTFSEIAREVQKGQDAIEAGKEPSQGASLAKHVLNSYLMAQGDDYLSSKLEVMEYSNRLLAGHLDSVAKMGKKLGMSQDEIFDLVGADVQQYSDEMASSMETIESVMKNNKQMSPEEQAALSEQMDKIRQAVEQLLEKMRSVFGGPSQNAGPAPA
ncbi:hypothetical protein [Marinobacterium stanieri]|uniref:Uncharacterized protein n=1 Tax=Marinobacterium stanieri TaxID=49186 RepID=A0A1N6X993_9GAMM|nr:hypothetical protein [Marinobacterium stanieri]SIQ98839.1 hypothetical protein SAMN05421647_11324 [Marinobacterium stanieri]